LCLYPDKPTLSSVWDVYDLMGESVVHLSFNDGGNDCWNTQGVPPGIYAVRLKLNYMDGTQVTTWQKVLLSR